MKNFVRYFSIVIIVLYFFLAVYILVSPTFQYLTKEIRIIFAAFLFLYGGFRLARLWTKSREQDEE
jgi:positive regulator of sigma E activity